MTGVPLEANGGTDVNGANTDGTDEGVNGESDASGADAEGTDELDARTCASPPKPWMGRNCCSLLEETAWPFPYSCVVEATGDPTAVLSICPPLSSLTRSAADFS